MERTLRLSDMDASAIIHMALNTPEDLCAINPHCAWQHNRAWMVRWKPYWCATNKPVEMIQANPGWMAATFPETTVILSTDIMMTYFPEWVRRNRPDIYAVQPIVPGEHRPACVFTRKIEQRQRLVGWWHKLTDWHFPTFNAKVPDKLIKMVSPRDGYEDAYPEGVTRRY